MQATAKQLDEVLEKQKLYRDLLPDEKAAGTIKQILTDNLKGLHAKSLLLYLQILVILCQEIVMYLKTLLNLLKK